MEGAISGVGKGKQQIGGRRVNTEACLRASILEPVPYHFAQLRHSIGASHGVVGQLYSYGIGIGYGQVNLKQDRGGLECLA